MTEPKNTPPNSSTPRLVTVCAADVEPKAKVNDSAFRRGFVHGVCMAIDALNDKAKVNELAQYVDHLMDNWRYVDTDRMIIPPSFFQRKADIAKAKKK